mmetsp:Transcript_20877/g.45269  ORF Transcript_20877/g.45269 Transcript_20877/m.45269 type:complete len:240 (-) Transcript_20877:478-1197(-)
MTPRLTAREGVDQCFTSTRTKIIARQIKLFYRFQIASANNISQLGDLNVAPTSGTVVQLVHAFKVSDKGVLVKLHHQRHILDIGESCLFQPRSKACGCEGWFNSTARYFDLAQVVNPCPLGWRQSRPSVFNERPAPVVVVDSCSSPIGLDARIFEHFQKAAIWMGVDQVEGLQALFKKLALVFGTKPLLGRFWMLIQRCVVPENPEPRKRALVLVQEHLLTLFGHKLQRGSFWVWVLWG